MKKVKYEYWVDGPVVGVQDLHGEEAVTLHAAGVLLEIQREMGSLEGKLVIWRDGDHIWDGLFYRNHRVDMYPLGYPTFEAAKEALGRLSDHSRREYTFNGDCLAKAKFNR